jgi:cytochrome P450
MGTFTVKFTAILAASFALLILWSIGLVVQRLYFSPLSKFPGPKLAAATHWYQKYFDLLAKRHGGQFLWEIKRMHEKYGPVVRITPDELHIDDPDFWHQVYCNNSSTRPIDKQEKLRHRFGVPDAVFSTPSGEQHRSRRQAMAGFFSKQRLRESQDRVNHLVNRISSRISDEYANSHRVLNLGNMFSSLAVDVVTELCFRRCTNCTEAPDFRAPLISVTANSLWISHWSAHFRSMQAWIEWLPVGVVARLVPIIKPILDLRISISQQVVQILSNMEKSSISAKEARGTDRATLFDDIIASNLPAEERSYDRLTQEAFALTSAGMETVKSTMVLAVFHALDQPVLNQRIKSELVEAMPDPDVIPSWVELEKLPYLTGVINESKSTDLTR